MSENTGPGSDQPFTYTTKGGGQLTVPSMSRVPSGVLRKSRKLDEMDQMFTILEAVLDPAGLDVLDSVDMEEMGDFAKAWQEHSGVSMGESSAS